MDVLLTSLVWQFAQVSLDDIRFSIFSYEPVDHLLQLMSLFNQTDVALALKMEAFH